MKTFSLAVATLLMSLLAVSVAGAREPSADLRMSPSQLRELKDFAYAGSPDAQLLLAVIYLEGKVVDRNESVAKKFLFEASRGGHPVAQYQLGHFFETGRVVGQDDDDALYWYKKSAEQNYRPAAKRLADLQGIAWVEPDTQADSDAEPTVATQASIKPEAELLVTDSEPLAPDSEGKVADDARPSPEVDDDTYVMEVRGGPVTMETILGTMGEAYAERWQLEMCQSAGDCDINECFTDTGASTGRCDQMFQDILDNRYNTKDFGATLRDRQARVQAQRGGGGDN